VPSRDRTLCGMTTPRTHRAVLLLGGLALTIGLTACAEAETQEEAESAACDSLAAVEAAADDVRALDATSTGEQAQAAADELRSSLQQLRTDAADLREADADAIEAAADQVRDAVDDVDPELSIEDNVDAVVAATPSLDEALAEIRDGLGCA
jgi:hypothetical protein